MPVYRALTIAGTVLERDGYGDVQHVLVTDTTMGAVVVNYVVAPARKSSIPLGSERV